MLNQRLDLVFQALADPARRGMIERLSRGSASVSELAKPFDMTLSAVVQHLAVLETSGLVRSEKVGRVRTCQMQPAALNAAETWITGRKAQWERHLDRLGEYLAEEEEKREKEEAMTQRKTEHSSFVVERTYPFAVAKVFKAWADPVAKAKWFAGPPDVWTLIERSFDFRVGGVETASGRFKQGVTSHFRAHYLEIIEGDRIIYSYGMHLDDRHISESLACVELRPEGSGTKLIVTEHGIFLDGYEDNGSREQGTSGLMDRLGASLTGA